jgi:hypothetical protein
LSWLLVLLACSSPTERAQAHLAEGQFQQALEDAREARSPLDPELLRALAVWTLQHEGSGLDLIPTGSSGDFEPALEALLASRHPAREPALLRLFDELDAQVARAESQLPSNDATGELIQALQVAAVRSLRSATLHRVRREGPPDLLPTLEARYGPPEPEPEHGEDPQPYAPELEELGLRLEAGDAQAREALLSLLLGRPVAPASQAELDALQAESDRDLRTLRTLNELAASTSHFSRLSQAAPLIERIPDGEHRRAIYEALLDGGPEQREQLANLLARTGDPEGRVALLKLKDDPALAGACWLGLHRMGQGERIERAYVAGPSLVLAVLVLEEG